MSLMLASKKRKPESAVPSDDAPQPASPTENGEAGVEQDESALSHAAKRKQRKLVSKETLTKSQSQATNKLGSDASTTKRQNSVWVGNLAFGTTRGNLRDFFKDAGEVTHIRMPMQQQDGKSHNRGFAHVDFATAEAKTKAITYSERELDDRRLLIKDGNDFSGRPRADPVGAKASGEFGQSKFAQKVLREQQHPPAPTLFLGNLSFVATVESIRQMFESNEQSRNANRAKATTNDSEHSGVNNAERDDKSSVSTLRKVRIGTFEDSGVCKGWAFLDFESTEHATAALTDRRNHSMDGRQLKAEFASREAAAAGLKYKKSASNQKPRDSRNDGVGEEATRYETERHEARPIKRQRLSAAHVPSANAQASRPGKAMVSASRERGSILPIQGKKIKF